VLFVFALGRGDRSAPEVFGPVEDGRGVAEGGNVPALRTDLEKLCDYANLGESFVQYRRPARLVAHATLDSSPVPTTIRHRNGSQF